MKSYLDISWQSSSQAAPLWLHCISSQGLVPLAELQVGFQMSSPRVTQMCSHSADLVHSLSECTGRNELTKQVCYCGDPSCCSSGPGTPDFAIFCSFSFPTITALFSWITHISLLKPGIILPHFVCKPVFSLFSAPTVIYLLCCYSFPKISFNMPHKEHSALLDTLLS